MNLKLVPLRRGFDTLSSNKRTNSIFYALKRGKNYEHMIIIHRGYYNHALDFLKECGIKHKMTIITSPYEAAILIKTKAELDYLKLLYNDSGPHLEVEYV